uniref:Ig-like domain-containing protein n=1 Tax=Knipowitschia caucasica TaxID=637954 RepID=A0AAV2KGK5_KNICA
MNHACGRRCTASMRRPAEEQHLFGDVTEDRNGPKRPWSSSSITPLSMSNAEGASTKPSMRVITCAGGQCDRPENASRLEMDEPAFPWPQLEQVDLYRQNSPDDQRETPPRPPRLLPVQTLHFDSGDTVTLTCLATGFPAPALCLFLPVRRNGGAPVTLAAVSVSADEQSVLRESVRCPGSGAKYWEPAQHSVKCKSGARGRLQEVGPLSKQPQSFLTLPKGDPGRRYEE